MGHANSSQIANLSPCCNGPNREQEIVSEIRHNTSNNPYHLQQSVSRPQHIPFAQIEPNQYGYQYNNLPPNAPNNTHFSMIWTTQSDDRTLGRRTQSNIDAKKIVNVSPNDQYRHNQNWIINENDKRNTNHVVHTGTMIQVEMDENDGYTDNEEDEKEIMDRSHHISMAKSARSEYDIVGRLTYHDESDLNFNGAYMMFSNSSNHASPQVSPELSPTRPRVDSLNAPEFHLKDKTFSIPNNIKDSLRVQGKVGSVGILTNTANDNDMYTTNYVYPKNFN